jgi:hypothetical protein
MVVDIAARSGSEQTPARLFLEASAIYHLVLAIAGFVVDQTFPLGADATESASSGYVFGIFETNGWHSLAGLLVGLISLFFWLRPARAREAAFALGLSQLAVVISFALWPPSTFSFASNGADQVIHSITAIGGIASALLTRPDDLRS